MKPYALVLRHVVLQNYTHTTYEKSNLTQLTLSLSVREYVNCITGKLISIGSSYTVFSRKSALTFLIPGSFSRIY